jgi:hypothetical protein
MMNSKKKREEEMHYEYTIIEINTKIILMP